MEAEKRGMRFPRKGAIVRPMKHESEWRVNVTQRSAVLISRTDATMGSSSTAAASLRNSSAPYGNSIWAAMRRNRPWRTASG